MFTPTAGAIIGERYILIEEIGRGAMGSVWKAEHKTLGAACAIKFMLAGFADEASSRQRFLSEARGAARVQSPHVARVFDVDEWDGRPYIAMEFLEGETLDDRLERVGALKPELTCEIIDQMSRGLARAHAARLIHRDLKPGNVFLVRQEPGEPMLVKLLDFGLVKHLDRAGPNATNSGMLLGTPGYMSPEQALGPKAVDERADLWSLAAIAFHCLTGKKPFPGDTIAQVLLQVVNGELPVPSRLNPQLPPAFDLWWQRAAHRVAAERPSTALILAAELRRALGLAPAPASDSDASAVFPLASTVVISAGPGGPRADTLEPASKSGAPQREGMAAYAIVAIISTAIGSGGLLFWAHQRSTPTAEVEATTSESISKGAASAVLGISPEAPRTGSDPETGGGGTGQTPPSERASSSGEVVAVEVSRKPDAPLPAEPAELERNSSTKTRASQESARARSRPTSRPVASMKQTHPSSGREPPQPAPEPTMATERPTEKKHDRLGF